MEDKERVVMVEDKINHYVPSNEIEYNFLFDTCALNRIVKSNNIMSAIEKTESEGYNYYISDAQMRELSGIIDRKGKKMIVDETIKESNKSIFDFIEKINCKRVSCVALLLENFWKLDGSFRLLDKNLTTYTMFEEIYNNNRRHLKDAVIAEAAIHNNCTLVTSDDRLNKKVNKYFKGRSLFYDDFISKVISAI